MSTTVVIELPWGRYHGTPWGRNVNEGMVDWPPEPWRMLRALYATWRARAPELPADVVASLLDSLAEPPSYVLPPHTVAHTRHFYPDAKHGPRTGGTDKVFDTFAVTQRGAEIAVTWPVDLTDDERDALGVLCDRLTYLGRADSICIARLHPRGDGAVPGEHRIAPAAEGETGRFRSVLAAERPLAMASLGVVPQRMRHSGRVEPAGSRRVPYPVVDESRPWTVPQRHRVEPVTAVRLRLTGDAPPSPMAALALADALRRATLKLFDPKGTGRHSTALFGKDDSGDRVDTGHQHAHFLALTSERASGRAIDTLVVWAPVGLDEAEVAALDSIPGLGGRRYANDFRWSRVAIEAAGPVEAIAPEIVGPARRWRSFTPFAPPRNVRRQPTWHDHAMDYARRDLARAGFPPAIIKPARGQWMDFRRHRPGERLADARRATGLVIAFDEAVTGPISLGALRHFGLGLFVPDSDA